MTRSLTIFCTLMCISFQFAKAAEKPPNILIMISDDQSFPHTSAYGSKMVSTPNFDRIAKEGILFNNAFCAAPGCSPSRAALLTGREIWQIEHAGTHASSFGKEYITFMDLLAEVGYHTGSTGKAWGPGNWKKGGRTLPPAGKSYQGGKDGYAGGFKAFLEARPKDAPFAFWFGSSDPHRAYKKGTGRESGKTLAQAEVPTFLPDTEEIRDDLLDYSYEIERFDRDCGKMLELLEATGDYDNTIIIITSDNGMPFPYAKANCNEFGIHMPLAISWKKKHSGGMKYDGLLGFIDITATIHDVAGIQAPEEYPLTGRSFLGLLTGNVDKPFRRDAVFSGRERHSSSRFNTLSYPQRCIRTDQYLFVRNLKPERWPAGPGQKLTGKPGSQPGPEHGGYHDIDGCPSLSFLIENRDDPEISKFFHLAVDKRPAEQLFDIKADPGCINDLAADPGQMETVAKLSAQLDNYLKETNDPRVIGNGDIFETYPRYSPIRWFPIPEWAKEHPESVPETPWLDKQR